MRKKTIAKICTLALAGVMVTPLFAGCGGSGQTASGGAGNADAEYTLNVYVYEAGYGTGWVQEAADTFCEKYPNYKVDIYSDSGMFETLKTQLNTGNCPADVALISDGDYRKLAGDGKLTNLDDLLDSALPDSDTKIKDVIPEAHLTYRDINGSQYGLPWQDNCASGIIYNKTFFANNNLKVPETMDEYFALCEQILALDVNTDSKTNNDVTPLVYCGGKQSGYTANILNQWFVEYYGYDYMQNTFYKYDDVQYYRDTEKGRTKVYETMAKMLKGENAAGKSYVDGASTGYDNAKAQGKFVTGKAAMYICGPWFPTETKGILEEKPDFDYGFFGIPHINADKKDASGNDSSNVRYSLGSNALVVPKTSKNKAGAKLFLAELYSESSLAAFVQENNGVSRPMTITPDISGIDTSTKKGAFAAQVYAYYKGTQENPTQMVYEISLATMSKNGKLAPCIFQNEKATEGHTLDSIIKAKTYADAKSIATKDAANETKYVESLWDTKTNNWNADYLKDE